ncbi:glycosyltransferase family 4 protein [Psychroflexus halocasei]|uniref:Glycosyltransferase involved in cell wall bisynthesis n=1 Tax=Psychroflexus halocasei TaxID=908615 RepID=A0A1H4C3R9_9FLAO|nr:glycosyltransferase family 4 protein [Psychroflexus halocasei]SEA54994.1 Glycosyltransferase involved in cell wall bisynthesis [Psychroflexus halocasei]
MHIVFLTGEYPKEGFPHGGVGTVVQIIARELVRRGFAVSILGLNYLQKDEVEEDQGVKIYRYKRSNIKKMGWLLNNKILNKAISDLHQKQPIDVVESAELGLAFIKKIKGIKYLIRMHGGHHFFAESENRAVEPWKAFQEKRSFKKADHIVGVSEYVLNHTAQYIDYKEKRGEVIFNPANFGRFYPANYIKEIKGRLFFAGSICEKKGIRQLVKALPLIKKVVPEAHLVIAGRDTKIRGTQKSYLEFLKSEIPDEVQPDIHFLGAIENTQIPKEIEKAEVCVYPSHMEAMPLAWIEVLSMGKAFVASNFGPGPEAVKHGKTGLLCNPLDIPGLAKQVIYMLKNRDEAHQMGQNAIKDVNNRFSLNVLMQQNVEMYRDLIEQ